MAKKAVVCGAGGFIASHLVARLKKDGYWVRGVDIKQPEKSEDVGLLFCNGERRPLTAGLHSARKLRYGTVKTILESRINPTAERN